MCSTNNSFSNSNNDQVTSTDPGVVVGQSGHNSPSQTNGNNPSPPPSSSSKNNHRTKMKSEDKHVHTHDPSAHMVKNPTPTPSNPVTTTTTNDDQRRLSDLMYIEHHTNGGGYVLHAYADELALLTRPQLDKFANLFLRSLFAERTASSTSSNDSSSSRKRHRSSSNQSPGSYYCIGIVHGAARGFPELLHYLSALYPTMSVNTNPIDKKHAVETLQLANYVRSASQAFSHGIYRYGPLHAISLVGVKGEERGCYCQPLLDAINADPFLSLVTPWGPMSLLAESHPSQSDDGPILWARPGEQSVPLTSSDRRGSSHHRSSTTDTSTSTSLTSLLLSNGTRGRRSSDAPRSLVVHDRTPCHADHADDGLGRHTTAAVGLLKAFNRRPSRSSDPFTTSSSSGYQSGPIGRIIKDVVVFDPRHYAQLVQRLQLDIMEPPMSQCGNFWADDAELNQLRSEGYRYARLPLRDNDIYFIPRNAVHQFKTISSGVSVAWHLRLKAYYPTTANTSTSSNGDQIVSSTTTTDPDAKKFLSTAVDKTEDPGDESGGPSEAKQHRVDG